jgi:hypothetical protein
MNPIEEPTPMNNNNALLEEINEIENSINNSNIITPINTEKEEPVQTESQEPINIEQPTIDDDDDLDFIEEFEDEEPIQNKEQQIESNNETIEASNDKKQIVIPETKITNLKDVIGLIRECSEKIEAAGFMIDTEELDLEDMYQVIFRINK